MLAANAKSNDLVHGLQNSAKLGAACLQSVSDFGRQSGSASKAMYNLVLTFLVLGFFVFGRECDSFGLRYWREHGVHAVGVYQKPTLMRGVD